MHSYALLLQCVRMHKQCELMITFHEDQILTFFNHSCLVVYVFLKFLIWITAKVANLVLC
jgi:hypothetical protein